MTCREGRTTLSPQADERNYLFVEETAVTGLCFQCNTVGDNGDATLVRITRGCRRRKVQILVLGPRISAGNNNRLIDHLNIHHETSLLVPPRISIFRTIHTTSTKRRPLTYILYSRDRFFAPTRTRRLFVIAMSLGVPIVYCNLQSSFSLGNFPNSAHLLRLTRAVRRVGAVYAYKHGTAYGYHGIGKRFIFRNRRITVSLRGSIRCIDVYPRYCFGTQQTFCTGQGTRWISVSNEREDPLPT